MSEPISPAHSEGLFQEIASTAKHPKTIAALNHIKAACDYLEQHHIEISVAEVGLLCRESGPALQSIHNNRRFKDYIGLRRGEQTIPARRTAQSIRFLAKDPETQVIFDTLEAEAKRERKRYENAKRALQSAGVYDYEKTLQSGCLVRVNGSEETGNSQVARALRNLFNLDHLRRFGLEIIENRVVATNRNGRVFMEKGDYEVLVNEATRGLEEPEDPHNSPKGL